MKKTILTAILVLVFMAGHSQTSLEEYNYITKGYQTQIEQGLDMKKGYELNKINSVTVKERTVELKSLIRNKNGKKEIAAYMIIYNFAKHPTEYICVPNLHSDPEIMDKFFIQLHPDRWNDDSYRLQMIVYLLSKQIDW